tara:strand:- start:95 stop:397 length:303 start_codon:yes stop_codon:yes gene_type:complete
MSAETIYSDLKSEDNKKLWAYAKELAEFRRKADMVMEGSSIDWNDKSSVKLYISEALKRQMDNGSAAAARELVHVEGIKEDTQDLIIEPVNFAEVVWETE